MYPSRAGGADSHPRLHAGPGPITPKTLVSGPAYRRPESGAAPKQATNESRGLHALSLPCDGARLVRVQRSLPQRLLICLVLISTLATAGAGQMPVSAMAHSLSANYPALTTRTPCPAHSSPHRQVASSAPLVIPGEPAGEHCRGCGWGTCLCGCSGAGATAAVALSGVDYVACRAPLEEPRPSIPLSTCEFFRPPI